MPTSQPAPDDAATIRPLGGRKADQAHDMLKRAILLRQLSPGMQILEQSLARDLACSQGTVREALIRLEGDGLVARRGYRGTLVTETSQAEAVEMVRVRLSVERAVARRIAESGIADTAPLSHLLAEMDAAHAAGDLYYGSELDRAFHTTLADAAGMGLLAPILHRCALHIHRFTLGGVEVPRDFFQEAGVGTEHRALLDTLTGSPPEVAAAASADHLARVLSRWAPSLYRAAGAAAFET